MHEESATIGFIGGGNMAQAIIRGLLDAGHPAERIQVADPSAEQHAALSHLAPGLKLCKDNGALPDTCDLLILAVKPQLMAQVATELATQLPGRTQAVVSIAAGTTLASLRGWLGDTVPLIRVMPNTPALIGAGMSGLYADAGAPAAARELANYAMAATGTTLWVDNEALLDAVTAVSGSGPAYFFLIIEIMQEIGQELGLSAEAARLLATQTAAGAGLLAAQTDEAPATLRKRVTSPGGTTAAALQALESGGIRDIFRTALFAARDRAVELGNGT